MLFFKRIKSLIKIKMFAFKRFLCVNNRTPIKAGFCQNVIKKFFNFPVQENIVHQINGDNQTP